MEITLEEVVELAENGNVDAMIALGRYYAKDLDEHGEDAAKWFESAAKHGDCFGILMTINFKVLTASYRLDNVRMFGYDSVKEPLYEAYPWCTELKNCICNNVPGIENVDSTFANNKINETLYFLARCKYITMDDSDEILPLLEDTSSDPAALLKGVVLFKEANNATEYEEAYLYLSRIVNNDKYANTPKIDDEELIYGQAAAFSSICLRMGLGTKRDVNAAARVLTIALNTLRDEGSKKIISGELQHYQKKAFGGYKYVE